VYANSTTQPFRFLVRRPVYPISVLDFEVTVV